MNTATKFLIGTLVIGLPAFLLLSPHSPPGNLLWQPADGAPEPSGFQVPMLMVYGLASALSMGFGLTFLLFGRRWTEAVFRAWSLPAHLAITFITASFWLHDNLHMVNGMNLAGLIAIEYLFHLPLMLSGLVLVLAAAKTARLQTAVPAPEMRAAPS